MQVINVLRDQNNFTCELFFQSRKRNVPRVRFGFGGLRATGVVKICHELRIAGEPFGRRDVLDAVLRPQPAFGAESPKTTFR